MEGWRAGSGGSDFFFGPTFNAGKFELVFSAIKIFWRFCWTGVESGV